MQPENYHYCSMKVFSRCQRQLAVTYEPGKWLYEGRSINKFKNGAIPLILQVGKI